MYRQDQLLGLLPALVGMQTPEPSKPHLHQPSPHLSTSPCLCKLKRQLRRLQARVA